MLTGGGRLALLALGDATLLLALRDEPGRLAQLGSHLSWATARTWVDAAGVDTAAVRIATAVLWLACVWFAVGLLAVGLSATPGAAGRIAARVARATLPRALYRVAASAAGLGVLFAPVNALAHGTSPQASNTSSTPAPIWPTDDPVRAPAWPASPPAHQATHVPHPPAPGRQSPGPDRAVVVRPGDSLWRIAAQHLRPSAPDRRIAEEWPRWYAANRSVIGTDPDHIVAGQVLTSPHAHPKQQRRQP